MLFDLAPNHFLPKNSVFFFSLWDSISLCNLACHGTISLDQADLNLQRPTCFLSIKIKGMYHYGSAWILLFWWCSMIPCCLAPPLMPRLPLSPSVCTCLGTHIAGCFPLEPAEHKQESWWGTGYLLSHLQGKEEKVKMTRFPDWYTQIIWLCKSDKTAKDKKLSCFRQIFLLDYFKKRRGICAFFLRNYFTWILIGIWDPSRWLLGTRK